MFTTVNERHIKLKTDAFKKNKKKIFYKTKQ